MELLFYITIVYWVVMFLSGGCGKYMNNDPNAHTLFNIGFALTGLLIFSAVLYDFIALIKKKNKKEEK